MKLILNILKPERYKIYVSLLLKTIGAFADLLLPWLIAYMIDETIPGINDETKSLNELFLLGAIMIIVAGLGLLLNVVANRRAEKIASEIVFQLRNDLFEKITHLEANQIDDFTRASIISRMTSDTYNIYSAIASLQRIGIRAPILLIGGLIFTLFLDPVLTLVMVCALPLLVILVSVTTKKGAPLYRKSQQRQDRVVRVIREYVSGVRVIRALGMETEEINKYDLHNKELIKEELNAHRVMAKVNPLMNLTMNIGLVSVLLVGAYRFQMGLTKDGVIVAFMTYFTIILVAMMSITRIFTMLTRASASGDRIQEVLASESTFKKENKELNIHANNHITFENVSFSYKNNVNQLDDISFTLKKGQTLGIIGATGSGKTTIVNLILRFYEAQQGRILFYDEPIENIDIEKLRRSIGVVFQNDIIFANSLQENISLSRKDISPYDLTESIDIAQADFIYEKQNALNDIASQKGANLSGGQKQRILIARALVNKPQLLILDDASSALDYQTDQNLRKSLFEKLKSTTKIIVAQRVSSIKSSDIILLIHEGKIVAKGTHETLMASSKMYQEIANYQMGDVYE